MFSPRSETMQAVSDLGRGSWRAIEDRWALQGCTLTCAKTTGTTLFHVPACVGPPGVTRHRQGRIQRPAGRAGLNGGLCEDVVVVPCFRKHCSVVRGVTARAGLAFKILVQPCFPYSWALVSGDRPASCAPVLHPPPPLLSLFLPPPSRLYS